MNILICNDDGIFSEGIITLANVLSKNNKVTVVAPDTNRSACSHSMSFYKELTFKQIKISDNFLSFSLSGTPADCVKFSLFYFKEKFDLIIGGVNIGFNIGTDILYSGTVSIAIEACLNGYKNLALSVIVNNDINYNVLADNCEKLFNKILPYTSKEYVLNINIPNEPINKLKFAKLGIQKYIDTYKKLENGNYMLVGEPLKHSLNDGKTDVDCFFDGFASVTPIIIDKTNFTALSTMPKEIIL